MDLAHRLGIGGIRHGDDDLFLIREEGHGLDPPEERFGEAPHEIEIGRAGREVDVGDAELLRERPADVLFGGEAQLDQALADQASGLELLLERGVHLFGGHDPAVDQDRRQGPLGLAGLAHGVTSRGVVESFRRRWNRKACAMRSVGRRGSGGRRDGRSHGREGAANGRVKLRWRGPPPGRCEGPRDARSGPMLAPRPASG
jgi:hypothetical protein